MDPNTLLDEASPRVTEMSPELRSLLDQMVSATRPRSRRRTRLALTAVGLGAAVAVGVAGTAAASIVMHYTSSNVPDSTESASFSWTLASGRECTLDIQVGPRADEDPDYSSSQMQTLSAARDWMAVFDIDSIDIRRAESEWLRQTQHSQGFSADEVETYAVVDAATSDLAIYLEARGYELRSLNSGAGLECDQ